MLDNIPHIKAFWIMLGLKVAQISTAFGVDDLDGTVVEERITHMAGATTPEALSKDDLVGMIEETGHVAVERDTLYRIVKRYAEETEAPAWNAGPIGAPPLVGVFPREQALEAPTQAEASPPRVTGTNPSRPVTGGGGSTMSRTTPRFVACLAIGITLAVALALSAGCGRHVEPGRGRLSRKPCTRRQACRSARTCRTDVLDVDRLHQRRPDVLQKGGITYSVALNLTATNPTGDIAGTYSGTATAKTTSTGDVGGAQLNASAIANSTQLEFTLEDATEGDPTRTAHARRRRLYVGTGTIAMKAAGSGTVGRASGAFKNTSGQPIKVTASGSNVTLAVTLVGHTYTFKGTIRGK